MRRPRRAARGQATVELALGVLILVTVITCGIYFAEVAILSLRVQQSATSAMWDTTGVRTHRRNASGAQFYPVNQMEDGAGRSPAVRAEALYEDFDGRSSQQGANRARLSFTQAARLNVRCQAETVAPPGTTWGFMNLQDANFVPDGRSDGLSCTASAQITAFNFPTQFFERAQGGFFKAKNLNQTNPSLRVCAFGRARGTSCPDGPPLAINEWAVTGSSGSESGECAGGGCSRIQEGSRYRSAVNRIFEMYRVWGAESTSNYWVDTYPGVSMRFVDELACPAPDGPCAPVDPRDFNFAYRYNRALENAGRSARDVLGRQGPYDEDPSFTWALTPAAHTSTTSPYFQDGDYGQAFDRRGHCFLGSRCNAPVF